MAPPFLLQIVTHLCYSDFEEIMGAIDGLDGEPFQVLSCRRVGGGAAFLQTRPRPLAQLLSLLPCNLPSLLLTLNSLPFSLRMQCVHH